MTPIEGHAQLWAPTFYTQPRGSAESCPVGDRVFLFGFPLNPPKTETPEDWGPAGGHH